MSALVFAGFYIDSCCKKLILIMVLFAISMLIFLKLGLTKKYVFFGGIKMARLL